MRYIINYWYGTTQNGTAPVYVTEDPNEFWSKVEKIKKTENIMASRLVEWPEYTVYAYATTQDGANGIHFNSTIRVPERIILSGGTNG